MSESSEARPSSDVASDRRAHLLEWEVSVARARERAVTRRAGGGAGAQGSANQAAYDELALSFEELTVAQEELRTLNDEVTEATMRIEMERRRYHELFHTAPVPYVVTDARGVVRDANQAVSGLLRSNAERILGKPLFVFVHDVSRRRLRRAILERAGSPGTSTIRFSATPRKSPPILVEATLSSAADRDGIVREIRWLLVDRTRAARRARARRDRAAELDRLVSERTAALEEEQRLKDRLVATVSHEFRTGLAAIGGFAELLEMGIHGALTPMQLADIRRIRSAYEHLGLVVDDLLSYGKMVAGQLVVETADFELGDAIRALGELLGPQARDRNIRLLLEHPGAAVLVRADAERLRQVLLNVAGNAIKFSPSGTDVVIRWRAAGGDALTEVIDTGPGIPELAREMIFEPFNRLESTRSVPGTGLGLAISRELARAMRGDLSVDQNPAGRGSRFILRLPRSTPLAAEGLPES